MVTLDETEAWVTCNAHVLDSLIDGRKGGNTGGDGVGRLPPRWRRLQLEGNIIILKLQL